MPTLTASSSPSGSTSTLRSQSEIDPIPNAPTSVTMPAPLVPLAEPDVIASTKPNVVSHVSTFTEVGPVAPPRRKKKSKPQEPPTELPVVIDSVNIPPKVFRKPTLFINS